MSSAFVYQSLPAKIIFGTGAVSTLTTELQQLGRSKALVLSTPQQQEAAQQLAQQLGPLCAGLFSQATMHTPVEITAQALQTYESCQADCVISFGGGSTIGLGKALAYRINTTHIAIPTTYAGSEVTPILGQTENKQKTTVRHPRILPNVVIYDPDLSLHLPVEMSITSGLNAMAHAIEALYAQDRNPISTAMAIQGVQALVSALPVLVKEPHQVQARSDALLGAWLCGTVLGTVGMSLHHKLCHTLGGSFNLPHAQTHAVLLPHSLAYNAKAAASQLHALQSILGSDLALSLYELAQSLGAPLTLKELGLNEADLDQAAYIATQTPYWSPRPLEQHAIRAMLERAWAGSAPQTDA